MKQSSGGDFKNLSERPPKEPEKSDRPQPAIDSIEPYTCARFSPCNARTRRKEEGESRRRQGGVFISSALPDLIQNSRASSKHS